MFGHKKKPAAETIRVKFAGGPIDGAEITMEQWKSPVPSILGLDANRPGNWVHGYQVECWPDYWMARYMGLLEEVDA